MSSTIEDERMRAAIGLISDEKSEYYVREEDFEHAELSTVKNGYKKRDGVHLPSGIRNLSLVKNMEVREDDVFSIGFPKSGTTWLEEIIWILLNNFNFEKAKSMHHYYRVTIIDSGHSKRFLSEIPSPRLFKSHLPLKFLPENLSNRAKVVYIVRNPKDIIVSFFKYFSTFLMNQFIGTLEEFVDMFVNGETMYGSWVDHVNTFTSLPGIYIIHYENLVEDPYVEIRKLAEFLGKRATDEQLKELLEFISFDNLKKSQSCNFFSPDYFTPEMTFFYKGKIGNWQSHLNEEMSRKVDNMIEEKLAYKGVIQFEPKK